VAQYLLRRVLRLVPHVLVIVTVVFFVFRVIPGDPALIFASPSATREEIELVRKSMGLDQPVLVQYGRFLVGLAHGNLGVSTSFGLPVANVLSTRLPATALLAGVSLALASALGISSGLVVALRPRAMLSQIATVIVIGLLAIPNFWLGLLLMQMFAVRLGWLPVGGTAELSTEGLPFLLMPMLAVSARLIALVMRTTRVSTTETLGEDFIRTARAKGVGARRVLWRHALKPALIPIITVIGLQLGHLLGGSIVIETLFTYQGIGLALIKAVAVRDYALVQGVMLLYALAFLIVNLIVDIGYSYVDPRIRYR
jgi:ABC-type dipeptide/oligopeptide/nickel transport system permease component